MATSKLFVRKNGSDYYCTMADSGVSNPKLVVRKNSTNYGVALTSSASKPRLCVNVNGTTKYIQLRMPADSEYLKVWLPFDESPTYDVCGNEWTTYGSPTIQTDSNAISGKSLYLDGSSYLQMSDGITLGGRDFTIDGWCYWSSASQYYPRFFALLGSLTSNSVRMVLRFRDGRYLGVVMDGGSTYGEILETPNHKSHYALIYTHSTSTVKLFVNGVCKSTFSLNLARRSYQYLQLGNDSTTANTRLTGNIEHFRIFDGLAKWTADFEPPTIADYYGEIVYLPFDESVTYDKCGNDWTTYGNPVIQDDANSISGKSLKMSTNTYLQMSEKIPIGGKDFTIDGWINMDSSTGSYGRVFDLSAEANTSANLVDLARYATTANFFYEVNTNVTITFAGTFGTRIHFAVVYVQSTTTSYLYLNGKFAKTLKAEIKRLERTLRLGRSNQNNSDGYFVGNIEHFRITDGKALWTADFTPPSVEDYYHPLWQWPRTKIYLPFDSTVTEDKKGNTWTTVGNPVIQDDENAISGKSLYLDGAPSYLQTSEEIAFGGQDFTVDFFAYVNSSSANYSAMFYAKVPSSNGNDRNGEIHVGTAAGKLFYGVVDVQKRHIEETVGNTITNARHHFAAVYTQSDATLRFFVDGSLVYTKTGYEIARLARRVYIGGNTHGFSTYVFRGSIEHFRIFDGVALWTENFTPPTKY